MIVELFGPPASGKTTLSKSILTRMQEAGQKVVLVTSDRPADKSKQGTSGQMLPVLQRIIRPAAALAKTTHEALSHSAEAEAVSRILAIMPPRGAIAARTNPPVPHAAAACMARRARLPRCNNI